mgnify:CR=1 FL=1
MDQFKVRLGLIKVLIEYAKVSIKNYYSILIAVIFTSVLFVFLPEIANDNSVISIIINILLAIVSGISLVVLCNIISKAKIIPNKNDVVITIIMALVYWFANSSLVVLASIFPAYKSAIATILPIIIDITFMFYLSKNVIIKTRRVTNGRDMIFLLKYGILYYFLRIVSIILIGIALRSIIGGQDGTRYLPAIGNMIRLLFIPVVFYYFHFIENKEKEIGSII